MKKIIACYQLAKKNPAHHKISTHDLMAEVVVYVAGLRSQLRPFDTHSKVPQLKQIPNQGYSETEIIRWFEELLRCDQKFGREKASGARYHNIEKIHVFNAELLHATFFESEFFLRLPDSKKEGFSKIATHIFDQPHFRNVNPLHPDEKPSVSFFLSNLNSMLSDLVDFRCACVSSDWVESLGLQLYVYRQRSEINDPQIIWVQDGFSEDQRCVIDSLTTLLSIPTICVDSIDEIDRFPKEMMLFLVSGNHSNLQPVLSTAKAFDIPVHCHGDRQAFNRRFSPIS